MLTSMRDISKGWLGRAILIVLMSLLILSFAVWGINDVFTGRSATDAATVGSTKISAQAYQQRFAQTLRQLEQQRGTTVTSAQAMAEGIDRQLLGEMLNGAALDEKAKQLGLAYTVEDAARAMTSDPQFQVNGQFNADRLRNYLQATNQSEQVFFRDMAQMTMRRHIAEAVGGGARSPQIMRDIFHRRSNEERAISFVKVTEKVLGTIAPPDDTVLKAFVTERQAEFRAPEYRKATLLTISPLQFQGDVQITDADIQTAYQEGLRTGTYGSPEKRTIQQLTFADEGAALAASSKLKAGTAFEALATELGQQAGLSAGTRTTLEIGDAALAAAIFDLPLNTASEPLKSGNQFVLVRVTGSTPAVVPPLADVKLQIETTLQKTRLASDPIIKQKFDDLRSAIDDARGSGKTLAEISAEQKVQLIEISSIDAAGKDKAGNALVLPEPERTVTAIFASAKGVDNEAIRMSDGGLVWFEIGDTEAARDLTFDEAKAKATDRWLAIEKDRLLTEKTAELAKKLEGGTDIATIATDTGASLETASLKRLGGVFGPDVSQKVFVTPVNKTGSATSGPLEKMLFRVTGSTVKPVETGSNEERQLATLLDQLVSEDLVSQYVFALQTSFGANVNEAAIRSALGVQ
jgi:peptidyl-prolyl cis-trans isomerase D